MSALVDLRRREDAHAMAIERGKAQLRVLQSVLVHFTDGLSARESGERLGLSRKSVQKYRSVLRLACWLEAVERTSVRGCER